MLSAKNKFQSILTNILKKFISLETILMFSSQIIVLIVGFLSTKIITGIGPAEYGIYSLILSISGFLAIVLFGPIEQTFIKYFKDTQKEEQAAYIIFFIKMFLSFVPVCLIISVVFSRYLNQSMASVGIVTMMGFIILSLFSGTSVSFLYLLQKRTIASVSLIIERVVIIIGLFVFAWYKLLNSINDVLIVFVFGLFIAFVFRVVALIRDMGLSPKSILKKNNTRINPKQYFSFAMPLLIWGLFGWFQGNIERWFIENSFNASVLGFYFLLYTVANITNTLPYTLLTQYFMPSIYNKSAENSFKKFKQYESLLAITYFGVFLVNLLLGEIIIELISDSRYLSYAGYLPLLSLGLSFFYLGQAFCQRGLALGKSNIYLFPKISGGVLSIIMSYLCILNLGFSGAVISVLVVNAYYLVSVYAQNRRMNLK